MIFENLTRDVIHLWMDSGPNSTHLLDEIGEKWEPRGLDPDTAKIFLGGWSFAGIDLAPGAKRETTINFINKETGGGTIFTLIVGELYPKGQLHTIHKIRLDQK